MSVNEMEWGADEELTLRQKKLSREEKKNEQAMRLFNKMEGISGSSQKPEQKLRIQQAPVTLAGKPRKKVKMDSTVSEKQSSPLNTIEFESSSASEHQNGKERSKLANIINSLYILNDNEDIYSHLVEYEMTQRAKYIDAITSDKLDTESLPASKSGLRMFSQEAVDRTGRAFSKIQNKFSEFKSKLNRLNSKQHKEFDAQFLNVAYLLN